MFEQIHLLVVVFYSTVPYKTHLNVGGIRLHARNWIYPDPLNRGHLKTCSAKYQNIHILYHLNGAEQVLQNVAQCKRQSARMSTLLSMEDKPDLSNAKVAFDILTK